MFNKLDGTSALAEVYRGWEGYQTSLLHAIEPLTPEQLAFRPAPGLRSVGELARHISLGRLGWFLRMEAPGSAELAAQIPGWKEDGQGNRYIVEEAVSTEREVLIEWLNKSWTMIEATLSQWTVADLEVSYPHTYWGKTYAVSRQWIIWRILSHDIHHGGQMTIALYLQGIEPAELGSLGGHLTEPLLWDAEVSNRKAENRVGG